jgi:dolichyl-phosphate beta-glucosyltransferase
MARLSSVVMPTLLEDVSEPLIRLDDHLNSLDSAFEVIIVDDSPDEHRAQQRDNLSRLHTRARVRFIDGPRAGKGAAVRLGVNETAGSVVFTLDADLPVPLDHVGQFLRFIDEGADVVIAERPLDRRFETMQRWAMSRALLILQRAVVFHSNAFKDTQCGFKAFCGDIARDIAAGQVVEGGMYDLEYLFEAHRRGAKVIAVTVVPSPETRASRINLWRCLRRDLIDVLRIRAKRTGKPAVRDRE